MASSTPTDARGRIMGGDPRYGRLCDCGNLKNWQSTKCWDCWSEERRDEAYWQRRTCACGGPKHAESSRCRRCKDASQVGRSISGRRQPENHPWRSRRLAA